MFKLKYLYRAFRYRFRNDPFEIAFIRSIVQKGQICADIGAHKGGYLYWLQAAVGEKGNESFRPCKECARDSDCIRVWKPADRFYLPQPWWSPGQTNSAYGK